MLTRDKIIEQILHMKTLDEDYAREALARINAAMPWLEMNKAIRAAMKAKEEK